LVNGEFELREANAAVEKVVLGAIKLVQQCAAFNSHREVVYVCCIAEAV